MSHTKSLFYANKVNDPHKRDRFKACIDTVGETLKLNTLIGVYSPMLGTEYAASKSDNNIVVYMSDFIVFFFCWKKVFFKLFDSNKTNRRLCGVEMTGRNLG